jgi:hypothetical protein
MEANITASLALHGRRVVDFNPAIYEEYSTPLCRRSIAARRSTMLRRTANNARKVVANTISAMHVPAYCPVEAGVQDLEKRGVLVEVKKVMAISFIPIIVVIPEEPSVDVDMGIPAIVVVGGIDIDMSMFI